MLEISIRGTSSSNVIMTVERESCRLNCFYIKIKENPHRLQKFIIKISQKYEKAKKKIGIYVCRNVLCTSFTISMKDYRNFFRVSVSYFLYRLRLAIKIKQKKFFLLQLIGNAFNYCDSFQLKMWKKWAKRATKFFWFHQRQTVG